MKKWNFKVKSNPEEVGKNLKSALGSVNGLVFNMHHDKKDSISFKMRKQILYAWYLVFLNSIIVNGKLSKAGINNETDVEISFNQHFLWKLVIFTHMFVGLGFLFAIISGKSNSSSMYLLGAIILAAGIFLWIMVRKKYEKNVREYKALIAGILGF